MVVSNYSLKTISSATEQELKNLDVNDVANLICNTAKDLESLLSRINAIKGRGFFKKMFANNTKDLADISIEHINASNKIVLIINRIININYKNRTYLQKLEKQILALAEKMNLSNNEIIINSASILNTNYSNMIESDYVEINPGIISKNIKLIAVVTSIYIVLILLAFAIFKII